MNILFLTTILPGGKHSGGTIVSQQIIEALVQNSNKVSVLGYKSKKQRYQQNSNEISIGERYIETKTAKYYPLIWMLSSWIKGFPYSAEKYYSKVYLAKIDEKLREEHYDIIIVDRAQIGWLIDVPLDNTKLIFISHNIEHKLYLEQITSKTNPVFKKIYQRESKLIKVMEDRIASIADRVWTLTAHDAAYFSSVINRAVIVLNIPTNEVVLGEILPQPSCDLGILGTWTWQPNHQGLQWFFDLVYPYLPTTLSIQVAGKGANWLQDLYPNVKYCGFVPDAQAFIRQAKVIAIPVISGGGIQIKTLEAISLGASIIATPKALRGIDNYPQSVKVASEPQDFANRAIELISQPIIDRQQQDAIDWSHQRQQNFWDEISKATVE
jgi:polysaccharide biosynthesis protein PslH